MIQICGHLEDLKPILLQQFCMLLKSVSIMATMSPHYLYQNIDYISFNWMYPLNWQVNINEFVNVGIISGLFKLSLL